MVDNKHFSEPKRRDYTQVVLTTKDNVFEKSPTATKNIKKKFNPPKKLIFVVIFIAFVTIFALCASLKRDYQIPNNIQESVTFPLYYPAKLPSGYSIKKDSFSYETGVVAYYAQNDRGGHIFFSIQPLPDKTALNDFSKRVLQNKVAVLSNIGEASIGTFNGRVAGSVVTEKSWVLVTASDNTLKTNMADILTSLKQD